MIADLFSMYLSFFPLRGKTSTAIAEALYSYISIQGVPKIIYSDNDPSFRGDVETLLTKYNIQHATSYPHVQRANTVEAQVRKVKNAARAAILENPLTNHSEWHHLYPLVIVRLNTMLSKYGASRELVHFQDVLHTHIPLITDIKYHEELEADLNFKSVKLRKQIGKFLRNKHKNKDHYKTGVTQDFLLHELVMRKSYTPESPLHPTFTGPYRIIELYPQGVTLKNTRTGEIQSVHYMNLRKITMDEFITLLPDDFDADILKNIGMYRYNKNHLPDPAKSTNIAETDSDTESPSGAASGPPNLKNEPLRPKPPDKFSDTHERILRSGKIIKINMYTLPQKIQQQTSKAHFSYFKKSEKIPERTKRSCLTRTLVTPRTAYATHEQKYVDGRFFFNTRLRTPRPENYHKKPYKSSFNSPLPGYLTLKLDTEENDHRTIKFTTVTVKFY
jgi:hypothetical protein